MRALLQRTTGAEVRVDGATVGRVGLGLVVLLGVGRADGPEQAARLARKVAKLRVFEDGDGKMNLSVRDVGGGALVVPQFTLYADARRGNRPGFTDAAPPDDADPLVERFVHELAELEVPVETGRFRTEMEVVLTNHGPITIWLDTDELG